ncbi:unnamed protein product [Arctogadus glacialis]
MTARPPPRPPPPPVSDQTLIQTASTPRLRPDPHPDRLHPPSQTRPSSRPPPPPVSDQTLIQTFSPLWTPVRSPEGRVLDRQNSAAGSSSTRHTIRLHL